MAGRTRRACAHAGMGVVGAMPGKIEITVIPNGPLKVVHAGTVRYAGQPLDGGTETYLCRCGQSKNAPFCDGSHKTNGFSGESQTGPAPAPEIRVWEGQRLRTFFNSRTCMHVFHCEPLKELRERELTGDAQAAVEIARIVQKCPSGALSFELKEDLELLPEEDGVPSIDIVEGGEVRIRGPFAINAELHERQNDDHATLCRCGLSKNKPWCDGRHRMRKDFR
jgi:CDGSH-type Zn-finger protein